MVISFPGSRQLPGALLCVANFPTNAGYAWEMIERLFAGLADLFAPAGVRTFVAYPKVAAPPRALAGSAASPVELDVSLQTRSSTRSVADFVRKEGVRALLLIDRDPWSTAYWSLRRAGAKQILVYDHTSGARSVPRGPLAWAKWLLARSPLAADRVLAVSDYVARRAIEVALFPASRVVRIHNALAAPQPDDAAEEGLRRDLGLPPGRPVVLTACRAVPEKGVAHLLRAFDQLGDLAPRPLLVYVGDGPQMPELRALRASLTLRDDVFLAGYQPDAARLMAGATVCVVPSVWQEAFGLTVLEAMLRARPVVASRVGGVPEMIEDGATGLLVEPGDEPGLALALRSLLADPERAARMGEEARRRATRDFSPERQLRLLAAEVARGLGLPAGL
jgi:glycosyltransferase involved in cell wall biosynthesis